jgi:hypothetical protein
MASLADKIRDTFAQAGEAVFDLAQDTLSWVIRTGVEAVLDAIGRGLAEQQAKLYDKLLSYEEIPEELRDVLQAAKEGGGEWQAILGGSVAGTAVAGVTGSALTAMTRGLTHKVNRDFPNEMPNPANLIELMVRGEIDEETFNLWMRNLAFADPQQNAYLKARKYLENFEMLRDMENRGVLSPDKVNSMLQKIGWDSGDIPKIRQMWKQRLSLGDIILARFRKYQYPGGEAALRQELKDQAWDDDRIDLLFSISEVIPPLADMVRFADFSAFDEEVIAKWREFYDAPDWIKEPFSLIGIKGEWANRYWFSHWIQPGRYELGELHRRGIIDDDEAKLAYRTMGYSSYWQNNLLELVKAVPTRVDVRRWWDMRTIDEARLREIYHALGYYGRDLDDYVLWTKVYVAFPDLLARWKNGWITEQEVRDTLTGFGMPAERVEELMQTKIKAEAPARVTTERDLTKSEIVKGVKNELITWDDGLARLQDMGYSQDEAQYILVVNIGAEGSPETPLEFLQITQLYRKAVGLKAKQVPQELIDLEKQLNALLKQRDEAISEKKAQPEIDELNTNIADVQYKLEQMLSARGLKK